MRMGSLEFINLRCFIFLFFLFFPVISTSEENCSPERCHKGEPIIQFPFRLEDVQGSRCGYNWGFDLSCTNLSKTVLELPSSGVFFIRDIDYISQEIRIYDPDNCLPRRLLYLDLSGSPFRGYHYQNYTFYNCSSSVDLGKSSFLFVNCLSSFTHRVWLTTSSHAELRITGCELVATVEVPIPWGGVSLPLQNDLHLAWDFPNCGFCEIISGKCGFNNTNGGIGCFTTESSKFLVTLSGLEDFDAGKLGLTKGVICGMSVGIGVPALMGFICCVTFCIKKCCFDGCSHVPFIAELTTTTSPQPVILEIGLDESTIDSYPKIVLGESRRLPKPDDSTCSICLSEYLPKETLRIIPECNHDFHADCIDEWLRMNMTCPVCRNSPNQQPPAQAQTP